MQLFLNQKTLRRSAAVPPCRRAAVSQCRSARAEEITVDNFANVAERLVCSAATDFLALLHKDNNHYY
jgi:hypothetical protein